MQEVSERMKFTDFVRFPRAIMADNTLSVSARFLFAILFDRVTLSQSNSLFRDAEGKIFCLFKQEDIASIMGKDIKSVRSYMRELENAGLLRRVSPGRKKADRLYLRVPDSSTTHLHGTEHKHTETMEDKLVVVYEIARKAGFTVNAAFCSILRQKVEQKNAPTVIYALGHCKRANITSLTGFLAAMTSAPLQEDKPVSTEETTLTRILEYAKRCGMIQDKNTETDIRHLVSQYGATAVYYKLGDCALNCRGQWGVNYLKTSLRNLAQ